MVVRGQGAERPQLPEIFLLIVVSFLMSVLLTMQCFCMERDFRSSRPPPAILGIKDDLVWHLKAMWAADKWNGEVSWQLSWKLREIDFQGKRTAAYKFSLRVSISEEVMCKDLFTLVSKSRLQGRKLEFISKVDRVFQVFSCVCLRMVRSNHSLGKVLRGIFMVWHFLHML